MQSTDIPTNAIRWNLDFNDKVKSIDQKPKNTYYAAENNMIKLTTNNIKGITSKDATIIILKQQFILKLISVAMQLVIMFLFL